MTTTTTAVTPEDLAAGAPDERVTSFHVRDVALTAPDGTAAGTMALITMDNGFDHTKPTTYGPNGLLRLRDALDAIEPRVAAGELAAVGITGKPFIFGVGADLKDVGTLTSREQALADRPARPRPAAPPRRARRAVVRVRQRRRDGRRRRGRAALHLPDDLVVGAGRRAARVLPRARARVGRHVPAPPPDRPGRARSR